MSPRPSIFAFLSLSLALVAPGGAAIAVQDCTGKVLAFS